MKMEKRLMTILKFFIDLFFTLWRPCPSKYVYFLYLYCLAIPPLLHFSCLVLLLNRTHTHHLGEETATITQNHVFDWSSLSDTIHNIKWTLRTQRAVSLHNGDQGRVLCLPLSDHDFSPFFDTFYFSRWTLFQVLEWATNVHWLK